MTSVDKAEKEKKSPKLVKRRESSHIFDDYSIKSIREQKAPKLAKIDISDEPSLIFSLSLLTAIILIFLGCSMFILAITSFSILVGLVIIIIGLVQVIVDAGWIAMIKANHSNSVDTWTEAYYSVASIRGQKIFIIPILIDFLLIFIALGSIFFF